MPDLAADWDVGMSTLQISEQSTARATNALIDAVAADRWRDLNLTFQKAPGDENWTVRASDFTGIARLDVGGAPVHLKVDPKVEGLDLFFLADWAYGTKSVGKKLTDARANLAALRPEPAACLLGWYVAEVLTFATRWLRRGYVVREEDRIGRVRGRIDAARYLSRSLSQARPHVIPARFTEPTHTRQSTGISRRVFDRLQYSRGQFPWKPRALLSTSSCDEPLQCSPELPTFRLAPKMRAGSTSPGLSVTTPRSFGSQPLFWKAPTSRRRSADMRKTRSCGR